MKKIAILGSTGSIGTQALDIIKKNPDRFVATALSCGKNIPLLEEQIRSFSPELVSVEDEEDARHLKKQFPNLEVLFGEQGLLTVAEQADCDLLLSALVGMIGMMPTYAAVKAGKDIALANKETLVAGGERLMEAVQKANVKLLPVDSEHSAIFQSLEGNLGQRIRRILLTASGGPFRGYSLEQLATVTPAQALLHPNWTMGSKITIDSATMMNKGLEVIEARWLFDVTPDRIDVLIHKESIIHSMVEYEDHSILAQLCMPDMRVPIAYAFTWPDRLENDLQAVDFAALGALSFEKPKKEVFRCLALAYDAIESGGSYPVVLNAANEVMVQRFLEGKATFLDIQTTIERVLEEHQPVYHGELADILSIDREIRERLQKWE